MNSTCVQDVKTRLEVPGAGITDEIEDVSNVRKVRFFPSGLLSLTLGFINEGSSATKCIRIVFDALDDLDAGTKLDLPTNRETVYLGERRTFFFSPDTPCNRVDVVANVEETGSNRVVISGRTAI